MTSIEDLPEEILVQIFLYLPRSDRLKCRKVCNIWKETLNTPSLWRRMVVFLDTDLLNGKTDLVTKLYHTHFRTMEFCWENPRSLPIRWLQQGLHDLVRRIRDYLMTLQNSFINLKSVKINDCDDVFRFKKTLYHLCRFLQSQRGLVKISFFNVNFNQMKCVRLLKSCLSSIKTLKYLDVSNCIYGPSSFFECLSFLYCIDRMEYLQILKLDYATLSDGVINSLLESKITLLNRLEIFVRESDNSSQIIQDGSWSKLCHKCPELKVALYFINVCCFEDISKILDKAIPLITFSLTSGRIWDHSKSRQYRETITLLIDMYYKSLENISLQMSYNREVIDDLLLVLIQQCTNLKYINFEGIIENMEILSEICKMQTESLKPDFKHFHISPGDINSSSHATLSELHDTYANALFNKDVDFKIHNCWNRNMVYVYY